MVGSHADYLQIIVIILIFFCLNSHSDSTYSLQKKPLVSMWCNSTFLQICSDFKLIYILNGLKVSTFWLN